MENVREEFASLRWRPIGPFRGGRVVAVAGHPADRFTFFFGSTGGGVWKTSNGGVHWTNVSDGFFRTSSVGAIAVAAADPNVVYAGMGECCLRGNVSPGDGVYRSVDGGASWCSAGLETTRHIGSIRVDPRDPERVYVAALGDAFAASLDRGVYRSEDGGRSWSLVLTGGPDAGAVDLAMDPSNPRVLFASLWNVRRYPWQLSSGGPGSGLFRSEDGGESWSDITAALGLAPGPVGKIGVAISPARPRRIWAIVEARDGGLFRSDDGGGSWEKVSAKRDLGARAFYYMHLTPHPADHETLFALNHLLWKSTNGGGDWVAVASPHPDHHALWIDPSEPARMILGCDGGAAVSFDGGESWSSVFNQPTGEMYHVTTDSRFPYRVYGAQQDNSTISIPSRSDDLGITERDWYDVGGSESGYVAVRPDDPDVVYAGSSGFGEGGRVTRYNRRNRHTRDVSPWPEKTGGLPAEAYTYRFQWTSPIVLSPHDPATLYVGANRIFRSRDEGESWEIISPDLTRDDPAKQQDSGGAIAPDNSGVEVYCTVFTIAESPVARGVLWAGSDDGRVHLSRDDGATWTDVTPAELPEWALISIVEPSAHDPEAAYLAATRYKLGDRTPYLLKTADGGRSWTTITAGIEPEDYTRVIRQDPVSQDLLFCGTETGVYVSFDGGGTWQRLTLNLPAVPVHDLTISENDLVAATHGRSFWILDDIASLRTIAEEGPAAGPRLAPPKAAYRFGLETMMYLPEEQETDHVVTVQVLPSAKVFYLRKRPAKGEAPSLLDAGENPPTGAVLHYYLDRDYGNRVTLEIADAAGNVVARFADTDERAHPMPSGRGAHRLVWDLRCEGAEPLADDMPALCAPPAAPGTYTVTLVADGARQSQQLRIALDSSSESSPEEAAEQYSFLCTVRDQVSRVHRAVRSLRRLYEDIEHWTARASEENEEAHAALADLRSRLEQIEVALVQPTSLLHQPMGSTPRLVDQLIYLFSVAESADRRPTASTREAHATISKRVAQVFSELDDVISGLGDYNRKIAAIAGAPLQWIEPESTEATQDENGGEFIEGLE